MNISNRFEALTEASETLRSGARARLVASYGVLALPLYLGNLMGGSNGATKDYN